jgi:hypothetical protein
LSRLLIKGRNEGLICKLTVMLKEQKYLEWERELFRALELERKRNRGRGIQSKCKSLWYTVEMSKSWCGRDCIQFGSGLHRQ